MIEERSVTLPLALMPVCERSGIGAFTKGRVQGLLRKERNRSFYERKGARAFHERGGSRRRLEEVPRHVEEMAELWWISGGEVVEKWWKSGG